MDRAVAVVVAAEVAEVADSAVKADGDRAAMAADTAVDMVKVDTAVVTMDTVDTTIMVVVGTEATAAATIIVDMVNSLILTRPVIGSQVPVCAITLSGTVFYRAFLFRLRER